MHKRTCTLLLFAILFGSLVYSLKTKRVEAQLQTVYIRANGDVEPSYVPIQRNGSVYTFTGNINVPGNATGMIIERDNMTLDGAGYSFTRSLMEPNVNGIELVGRSNVTIRNLDITAFWNGLFLSNSFENIISGNNITNSQSGLNFYGSSNNTISGNNITGGWVGIRLVSDSSNNTISRNNIAHNEATLWSYGIYLSQSARNVLSENNVTSNYQGIFISYCNNTEFHFNNVGTNNETGIMIINSLNISMQGNSLDSNRLGFGVLGQELSHYLHSIDTSNLVNNNPIYYLTNQQSLIINNLTHPDVGFLALINSTNVIVEELTLTGNLQGLLVAYTNNTQIQNNNVKNNEEGVWFHHSSNNTIVGNNITDNYNRGISLWSSSNNNTAYENQISDNGEAGAAIYANSSFNNIFGNNIISNDRGVELVYFANNNSIYGNLIRNSRNEGVLLELCSYNYIYGNNIENSPNGIYLDEDAENNHVYNNNFLNNTNHAYSDGEPNFLDNGIEGNYWDNYAGKDLNHDGIGDLNYTINANNVDRYPLMGPFNSFGTSVGKKVNVISNSTIDGFEYEPGKIRFYVSNMTANQTIGFCRVAIPHDVLLPPFNITIDGANPTYWNYTLYDNGTHRWIYSEYEHSTFEVIIIPEFSFFGILPLLMTLMPLVTLIYRRKHK